MHDHPNNNAANARAPKSAPAPAPAPASAPPRPKFPLFSWRAQSQTSTLHYITDHVRANDVLEELLPGPGPLGLDCEWRPNYTKGGKENRVALVQLADRDSVLLLQISAMSEFPSRLRALLADPSRLKAGVSIKHDCLKLFRDYGVSTVNCVELAMLARSVDNARWKGNYSAPLGLSRLLETYENFSLAKGRTQCSNWEGRLKPVQLDYAANDALAGYAIYARLIGMAQYAPNPRMVLPQHYSFSVVHGFLRDRHGVCDWTAQNPYYDPGPPPPPSPPAPPKNPNVPVATPRRTTYRPITRPAGHNTYAGQSAAQPPANASARQRRTPARNAAHAADTHDPRIILPPHTSK